ncbi:hypothetical protein DM01DRAFT_1337359 [Hesseltinella vesiculosa]|uniref:Uncharacterized protein n=1 Tax=Hesseltinella vesiculosa TaxID=101127 RepID=A0A1X2GDI7_9FUNG|nr:hypothetical protein DM01DRAFT_1337359 [Hesseltinella vesiculosa]
MEDEIARIWSFDAPKYYDFTKTDAENNMLGDAWFDKHRFPDAAYQPVIRKHSSIPLSPTKLMIPSNDSNSTEYYTATTSANAQQGHAYFNSPSSRSALYPKRRDMKREFLMGPNAQMPYSVQVSHGTNTGSQQEYHLTVSKYPSADGKTRENSLEDWPDRNDGPLKQQPLDVPSSGVSPSSGPLSVPTNKSHEGHASPSPVAILSATTQSLLDLLAIVRNDSKKHQQHVIHKHRLNHPRISSITKSLRPRPLERISSFDHSPTPSTDSADQHHMSWKAESAIERARRVLSEAQFQCQAWATSQQAFRVPLSTPGLWTSRRTSQAANQNLKEAAVEDHKVHGTDEAVPSPFLPIALTIPRGPRLATDLRSRR